MLVYDYLKKVNFECSAYKLHQIDDLDNNKFVKLSLLKYLCTVILKDLYRAEIC